VIASFLALTLLALGFVVFWIAWWLVADLFSGSIRSLPAAIKASDQEWRSSKSAKRRVVSH
jgi:hypothetical protein